VTRNAKQKMRMTVKNCVAQAIQTEYNDIKWYNVHSAPMAVIPLSIKSWILIMMVVTECKATVIGMLRLLLLSLWTHGCYVFYYCHYGHTDVTSSITVTMDTRMLKTFSTNNRTSCLRAHLVMRNDRRWNVTVCQWDMNNNIPNLQVTSQRVR